MTAIVVEYNRLTGESSHSVFDGPTASREAIRLRMQRERANAGRREVEVVVLSAPSIEHAMRTHGRYFARTQKPVA